MRGYIQIIITGALSCMTLNTCQESRVAVSIVGCDLIFDEPCRTDKVQFTLFNKSVGRKLDVVAPDAGSWFDPLLPTKLIIHGYNDVDQSKSEMQDIRRAYTTKGSYNVIYVEWWQLSLALCYPEAVLNGQHVAQCITELFFSLERTYPDFVLENVHAVGFSMGAHIAGYASNFLYALRGVKFARITGLDPAKPLLEGSMNWKHLDPSDAYFVDVLHTNAGFFGRVIPDGHVDFYVNGGRYQRNCNDSFSLNSKGCSHGRAKLYFLESITSEVGFWGVRCPSLYHAIRGNCPVYGAQSLEIMGEPCPADARGLFYVHTNMGPPYAYADP